MTVLVLDDEKVRLDAYAERYAGHMLFAATNAQEAIEWLKTWSFDVVHLDHDLGSGCETGYEVAKFIAEMDVKPELVVIHSHNQPAARRMFDLLRDYDVRVVREPFRSCR